MERLIEVFKIIDEGGKILIRWKIGDYDYNRRC